jgi:hypothetical protein
MRKLNFWFRQILYLTTASLARDSVEVRIFRFSLFSM